VWFRRGRLLIVSPDSLGTACPLSGRNSTYRPVQILEAGSGNIGAYLNKWIKIDYPFPDNGLTVETVDKKEFDTVKITLSFGFISSGLSAYFDRKKWDAKLVLLRPKDDLKAICRFNRIDRSEPTKGWLLDTLIASDCDLF
jgi:hypothetical protein